MGANGVLAVSQVSAGRKSERTFEFNGPKASVHWYTEHPNQLWIGCRAQANQLRTKAPSLIPYNAIYITHLSGGHAEAWPDGLKHVVAQM